MFVLVRHAHAGHQGQWDGADEDRPLSARGRRQAAGLLTTLPDRSMTRLVSSPLVRCRETLAPLADRLGLAVETSELLGPEADVRELAQLFAADGMTGAVLCTHGETLNGLLDHWRGRGVWDAADDRDSTQKGAAWIVRTDGGHHVATYLPPPDAPGETPRM